MNKQLLLTIIGKDKPGLVKQVSQAIRDNQGNWLESRLSHLGDQFVGLVLCEFQPEQLSSAEQCLRELSTDELEVRVERTEGQQSGVLVRFSVIGNDKPGIVYEISRVIEGLGANVESISSHLKQAAMSGQTLFEASITMSLPSGVTEADAQTAVENIGNDLIVELMQES